ncbi:MAG: efflux RND transporter periplasmic adaptor subunit [Capnocytophaga sp.]|nr:efflux RND transporter periplasmic adaptor subunit [Capnocytophaga sp.]
MNKIHYIIFLSVFVAACQSNNPTAVVQPSVKVTVQTAEHSPNKHAITASGRVTASQNARLSTRHAGYVQRVHVDIGQKVAAGQLLVSIHNDDLQAQQQQAKAAITQAQVAYGNAEKDFFRFQNLVASQSASAKEFESIQNQYQMAKAQLEVAKEMKKAASSQLQYTEIRAPFAGVITEKNIQQGDMAMPGTPLLTIENPSQLEVYADVSEHQVARININDQVLVRISSIDTSVEGKVSHISPSGANTSGQYPVKIALSQPIETLKPGMYANLYFASSAGEESLQRVWIPTKVLVKRGELKGVYTVSQEQTAILRWLRLGQTTDEMTEVLSGLTAGETYIVTSEGRLFNGAKVTP